MFIIIKHFFKLQLQENLTSETNALTPRSRKLKSIISTKENIIERQRLKIKRIQAQNRRLKKKVYKVEDILHNIHNKFYLQNEDMNNLKNINIQVATIITTC